MGTTMKLVVNTLLGLGMQAIAEAIALGEKAGLRQLGRALASHYAEIVVDRLFDGRTQLTKALQPLMQGAERTLQLNKIKRARTVVRVDGRREGVWTM